MTFVVTPSCSRQIRAVAVFKRVAPPALAHACAVVATGIAVNGRGRWKWRKKTTQKKLRSLNWMIFFVKNTFAEMHFHPKKRFSCKTVSSKNGFIHKQFYPKTIANRTHSSPPQPPSPLDRPKFRSSFSLSRRFFRFFLSLGCINCLAGPPHPLLPFRRLGSWIPGSLHLGGARVACSSPKTHNPKPATLNPETQTLNPKHPPLDLQRASS